MLGKWTQKEIKMNFRMIAGIEGDYNILMGIWIKLRDIYQLITGLFCLGGEYPS